MEALGFFVCVEDLADELIRSLGAASVEAILDAHGDRGPFRTLQKQPEWRLDLTRVPPPLDRVLNIVSRSARA